MKQLLISVIVFCCLWPVVPVQAAAETGEVIYPAHAQAPSRAADSPQVVTIERNGWTAADGVDGEFTLHLMADLKALSIQPAGNAARTDRAESSEVIPRSKIHLSLQAAQGGGAGGNPGDGVPYHQGERYTVTVAVEKVPAGGVYTVGLVAQGESQDEKLPEERLVTLVIKALPAVEASIQSGKELTARWTNASAPFGWPAWLDWLRRGVNEILARGDAPAGPDLNPPLTVALSLRGGEETPVRVTLDPVVDASGALAPDIQLQGKLLPAGSGPSIHEKVLPNGEEIRIKPEDRYLLSVVRTGSATDPAAGDGRPAPRIRPGTYTTTLHIQSRGQEQSFAVQINVRDRALWAVLAVLLGWAISWVGNYWRRNQGLAEALEAAAPYLAEARASKLEVVKHVLAAFLRHVSQRDGPAAQRTGRLLGDLLRFDALAEFDARVDKLVEGDQSKGEKIWRLVTAAGSLQEAAASVMQYCQESGAKEFFEAVASLKPGPLFRSPGGGKGPSGGNLDHSGRKVGKGLYPWWRALGTWWRALNERYLLSIRIPLWLAHGTFFVFVMGGMLVLQLTEVYGKNPAFGSGLDYFNLLLWGFAGDAARVRLADLAKEVMPSTFATQAEQPNGK